jgi:hypothetical protein
VCCSYNSVAAFTRLYWLEIVSFALSAHLLMHDLLKKRKEYAKAILPFLHDAERDG